METKTLIALEEFFKRILYATISMLILTCFLIALYLFLTGGRI